MAALFRLTIPFVCSAACAGLAWAPCAAQDEAVIDALTQVLAAEDARHYDANLFRSLARDPSPIVRRHVALAVGRIGDVRAGSLLAQLTNDQDESVRVEAVFGLGLLRDTAGLAPLRGLILNGAPLGCGELCPESIAAVSRIGGDAGATVISTVLTRSLGLATTGAVSRTVSRALKEAWRLGDAAPISLLTQYAEARQRDLRAAAIYSLARLRASAAANVLLAATEDPDPLVRAWAVRTLDASFADSAHINQNAVAARVERLVVDTDPHVRINALRSLATFSSPRYGSLIAERAGDGDPNVRVQALMSLGLREGPEIIEALTTHLTGGLYATRRQALLSLAEVQGGAALPAIQEWAHSGRWSERLVAVQALGAVGIAGGATLRTMIQDPDARVVAAALSGFLTIDTLAADSLVGQFAFHEDVGVRAAVFRFVSRHPRSEHVSLVLSGYETATLDDLSVARLAILGAIGTLDSVFPNEGVASRFAARFPAEQDPRVREFAAGRLPTVSAAWGATRPIATGRSLEDYRDLARELLLPAEQGDTRPTVIIETGRGNIIVELFPQDAPRTTQSFLELTDRRFFDGLRWHRVVPSFVIQDGDPRGDGTGGPGYTLRDEVSRRAYERGTLGLATAGPDTGGSQYFITLSPQPHLEGAYTVFGQVVSGVEVMERITQGDRVRRVRRQ